MIRHLIDCFLKEVKFMGTVKCALILLGLFLFLCLSTLVQAQEKLATYPTFPPGYVSIKVFDSQSRFVGRLLPEKKYWASIDQIPPFCKMHWWPSKTLAFTNTEELTCTA